jgi:hypothetical protein
MSHSEDSLTYSSLESDNITESILEGNMNVTNCFEPYQGELLPIKLPVQTIANLLMKNRTKITFCHLFWRSV